MKKLAVWSTGLLMFAAAAPVARAAGDDASKVDFGKQIVPVLKESCFGCHGAEKQKAKLSLHTPEAITKGSKEGPVLVKGDPSKSSLYTRVILPHDHEDIMPPEDEGKPLTKEQTDLISNWIKQGADFGGWKGDAAGAGTAGAAKEAVLPQVAAADNGALDKLRGHGALVLPLAQGINLLDVSFLAGADKVTDAQLADLAPTAQQVYALNLANTKITDAGLAAIASLPNLRVLHLEKTPVGDAGLVHLKGLAGLEYLNLYGTQVTDAGLAHLEGLKNLKNVYLWQSKVTDAGADKLRKALPNAKIDNGWKEVAVAAATPAKPADEKKDDKKPGDEKKDDKKPADAKTEPEKKAEAAKPADEKKKDSKKAEEEQKGEEKKDIEKKAAEAKKDEKK